MCTSFTCITSKGLMGKKDTRHDYYYTVSPHYSQTPHLRPHPIAEICLYTPCWNSQPLCCHFLACTELTHSAYVQQLKNSFCTLLSTTFPTYFLPTSFLCVFHYLKWLPIVLKFCLGSKVQEGHDMYRDKIVVLDKLHSGLIYSTAGHRFNINESPIHIT